jgi:hypothetical protein
MSTAAVLQARLKELSTTLGQIQPLVDRLRNFTASIGQGDEARVELGAEIHSQLKDAEGELELLRGDIEALDTGSDGRRKSAVNGGEKEAEKERVVAMAGRLWDDLKRYVFEPLEDPIGFRGLIVLISWIGLEEISGMLSYRLSGTLSLRSARNASCCCRGRKLRPRREVRWRSSRRRIWC